jgi:hypothetical protein
MMEACRAPGAVVPGLTTAMDVARTRRRTISATWVVALVASAGAAALFSLEAHLALPAVAFLLGWLALAGQ